MIIIRQAQMTAMEGALREQFVQNVVQFIRLECGSFKPVDGSTLPDSDDALIALIRDYMVVAGRFRIDTELGYVLFVLIGLGFARTFYDFPNFSDILNNIQREPIENIKMAMHEAVTEPIGE